MFPIGVYEFLHDVNYVILIQKGFLALIPTLKNITKFYQTCDCSWLYSYVFYNTTYP